jgi:lipid-binding SYLF domain-containing protein
MFGLFSLTCFMTVSTHMAVAQDLERLGNRGDEAAYVLDEIMGMPEGVIPDSLFKDSRCIAVIPGVVKVGLIVGGQHGRGLLSCRAGDGWSRPSFISITAGSLGLQIGAQATDFVLVLVNDATARTLTSRYIVLGGDASISAGPVGRTIEVAADVTHGSEIYSYSRSRGLFVGLSLEGASLRVDEEANKSVYNDAVDADGLLFELDGSVPAEVAPFVRALQRHDPAGMGVSGVGGLIE